MRAFVLLTANGEVANGECAWRHDCSNYSPFAIRDSLLALNFALRLAM